MRFQKYSLLPLIAAVVPVMMFGQQNITPVTVCRVLADPKKLSRMPVAIVGRLDCPDMVLEHPCWLEEDNCTGPFVSNGRTWPNKIWIEFAFPATPKSNVEIKASSLRDSLSVLRKSTKLGTHRVMWFTNKEGTIVPDKWSDQADEWGIAYGRLVITKALQNYSGAGVALKINPNDLRSIRNEEYPEKGDESPIGR